MEIQENLVQITNGIGNNKIEIETNEYEKIIFLYRSAMKSLELKLQMLQEEYELLGEALSIESVRTRIKKNKSIIQKLNKKECELTYKSMVENINDIAGIRVMCDFKDGVYKIAKDIEKLHGIKVVKCKDYMENPKQSGYMSYHMIVEVPVDFAGNIINVRVEIQLRTVAMDFWSSIEHKTKYKSEQELENKASKKFVKYAKYIDRIENSMYKLIGTGKIPLKS